MGKDFRNMFLERHGLECETIEALVKSYVKVSYKGVLLLSLDHQDFNDLVVWSDIFNRDDIYSGSRNVEQYEKNHRIYKDLMSNIREVKLNQLLNYYALTPA